MRRRFEDRISLEYNIIINILPHRKFYYRLMQEPVNRNEYLQGINHFLTWELFF